MPAEIKWFQQSRMARDALLQDNHANPKYVLTISAMFANLALEVVTTMKAAIYSRVSSHDKGQDLTVQSDELKAYCQRHDWEVVEYQDETSGAKASRPGLDRLIQNARLHRFDVLVVWKLDRLFRSMIDCVTTLDNLSRWGVRFLSLQDGLEIDPVAQSPLQRFQMQLFASLAELERGMIRERVQAGMDHARSKGAVLGRPRNVIDAAQVKALRKRGASWSEVSQRLGQTVGTCRRALERYEQAQVQWQ
jgi:DNA invertase Pin-like site-specific DNA recombinase